MLQFCNPELNPYIPKKEKLKLHLQQYFSFPGLGTFTFIIVVSVVIVFKLVSNTMQCLGSAYAKVKTEVLYGIRQFYRL